MVLGEQLRRVAMGRPAGPAYPLELEEERALFEVQAPMRDDSESLNQGLDRESKNCHLCWLTLNIDSPSCLRSVP